MVNCQDDNLVFGAFSNKSQITAEIVGKTTALPNGDGSGKVKFTSTPLTPYPKYIFNDGTSQNSPSGLLKYIALNPGV
jgi:hypothetical protein